MKLTTQQRLDRIERAINGIAYFAAPHTGITDGPCPELDEIRRELAGRVIPGGQERRPFSLPESREKAVV